MEHLGDITKINGYTVPVVDCVIGGSPCQDLSVAGKRAGLDGERSGLYMEQIRIVKEMRDHDRKMGRSGVDIRPRYMVWENVPGAFSSNKGEDFRIVLEEIAKVSDENAVIPMPNKGKWTNHGCIVGDGWSVAWRVLDAQFWGVPQRRRRIALVADFGGESASEILFVRKSVSGNTEQSKPERQGTSSDVKGCTGADDREGAVPYTLKIHSGCEGGGKGALIQTDRSATLSTLQDQTLFQPVGCDIYGLSLSGDKAVTLTTQSNATGSSPRVITCDSNEIIVMATQQGGAEIFKNLCPTITAAAGMSGNNQPVACYSINHQGGNVEQIVEDKSGTLTASMNSSGNNKLSVAYPIDRCGESAIVYALDRASFNQGKNAQFDFEISDKGINSPLVAKGPGAVCYTIDEKCANTYIWEEQANTLLASDYKQPQAVAYGVDCRNATESSELNGTLQAKSNGGFSYNCNLVVRTKYVVRRLTPLECERLQGYPDGWTDIGEYIDSNGKKKQSSDAARYKALGNSIALPPWKWVLKRLCACYERDATMASLFDGIGGFPYLWEQLNGKGSCLWASEIEEFPMAVTKVRIGDD